jgi:hypothetical protein
MMKNAFKSDQMLVRADANAYDLGSVTPNNITFEGTSTIVGPNTSIL